MRDQRPAAVVGNGEIDEGNARSGAIHGLDARLHGDFAVDGIASGDDIHHAAGGRVPLGDAIVVVDHPGNGDLHLHEGGGELRDLAQAEVAGEIFRGGEQQRDHGNHRPRRIGDPGQVPVLPDHGHPARHHGLVEAAENGLLVARAVHQRHAFGVVADAHHAEAEIALRLVLAAHVADQRRADPKHQPRSEDAVGQRHPHHVGRNGDRTPAAQIEGDGTADRPQDADEGCRSHDREHEADAEIDQRFRGPARVVGDAVLGVGRLLARDVEMIEALVAQPAGDQPLHQPGAPAHLQRLARQHDADADRRHGGNDQREHKCGTGDGLYIARLEAVEEPAVPVVQGHRRGRGQHQEAGEAQCQHPGALRRLAAPVPAGELAEGADHARIQLEARGVGGLKVISAHGRSRRWRGWRGEQSHAPASALTWRG